MTMIRFDVIPEFQRDCKKLGKHYRTLSEDYKRLRLALSVSPIPGDKHSAVLSNQEGVCRIIKIRMACRVLRKSSLRVIYAYFEQEQRIEFIELYFKGDKENEDRERIKEYLKNHQS